MLATRARRLDHDNMSTTRLSRAGNHRLKPTAAYTWSRPKNPRKGPTFLVPHFTRMYQRSLFTREAPARDTISRVYLHRTPKECSEAYRYCLLLGKIIVKFFLSVSRPFFRDGSNATAHAPEPPFNFALGRARGQRRRSCGARARAPRALEGHGCCVLIGI